MNNNYKFCNGISSDISSIKDMFDVVFKEEEVGSLAVSITGNMSRVGFGNWYLYKNEAKPVAGLVMVPWNVCFDGTKLNIWEQAIVGTLPGHRGNGLIGKLNKQLHKDAKESGVDFIIIQGIPGYYGKFGYRFAIDMENHINLGLENIGDSEGVSVQFREAELGDFNLIKKQDLARKGQFLITNIRSEDNFKYHLGEGKNSDYSSTYWVSRNDCYYCRVQKTGFGDGLIVSEISEDITSENLDVLLKFLKYKAVELKKPYIRFNLQENSPVSKKLINLGAKCEGRYGWQVKIVDPYKFLNKIKTSLQHRVNSGKVKDGVYQISFGCQNIDFDIEGSIIKSINTNEVEACHTIFIPRDLFEPLALGFKSYSELQLCRPDLRAYTKEGEEFINELFPKKDSWLYNIW